MRKWEEENIRQRAEGRRKWEAEVIALTRRVDNRKARRSQVNTDSDPPLEALLQTVAVTRRKVAGIEVPA